MSGKRFSLAEMEMSRSVQNIVNLSANILAFAISLVVSFFISPYIVKNLGAEANGFVTLANNFVSYATLVKTALNAIGSRYIIVAYHEDELDKANKYYSSLFFGDLFLSIVFLVLCVLCVWKLEHLINISENLITDVKFLFALIFANFIFSTAATVFNSAPYIKNKIYLQSIRDIQSNLIRAILLIALFSVFNPKIYFLGIASFIPGIVVILYNIYYKHKLVPELRVKKSDFSLSTIKELVSQGVWNSISSLGTILLTSLDLLIVNIFVSESEMGILSVAKSMPGMISGLNTTMSSVFFSAMTIDYAHKDIDGLVKTVKQSTMVIGMIITIPLAFLIIYGADFYSLWQPTLDANQLHILSVLNCIGFILCAGTDAIGNIFTITLQVRKSSISILVSGIVSILVNVLLIKFTSLGIYAIATVGPVISACRMIFYIVPKSAKYINRKKTIFYPVILKSLLGTGLLCLAGYIVKMIVPSDNWIALIASAVVFAVVGIAINFFIMFDKDTKKMILDFIKSKFLKRKS
ncbi:MAG: oligosaccharide flippase family protein [Clostridium sp.]|nr:oligosaccharide flippase family protein [Clostridium sp.]